MKTTIRNIVISAIFATVAGVSAVNAQSEAPAEDMKMANEFMQTAQAYVQSAVGADGNVLVALDGDVATLFGFVMNGQIKKKAEAAALKDERVATVRNHIVTTN